eukprot:CAMPEP_0114501848 /NCGR_PEP_ID=MMETSP0109-20121206/8724_1 /TAXON_ID=29199 /ORGANISM="Chlorarachnion reptans, Strain CCCM449" /LENGTH=349 /DNA_ID=CAMNT_0001679619 /DNA_START=39 /DNA_END=1088 /DNA_ORIENTATION=-
MASASALSLVTLALAAAAAAPSSARMSAGLRRSSPFAGRTKRNLLAPRAGEYDIQKGLKTGVLSANQQKVFLSETQLKSAALDKPAILENIENLKLLSFVEESGILGLLEKNGVTLKSIEKLGLLSTAENLGLLSFISDPNAPTTLYGTSFALALFSGLALTTFPDDNALEGTLKTAALLSGGGGALATALGARTLNTLQGLAYTQVGVGEGREELRNLASTTKSSKAKTNPPVLTNIEKLKLLSQVEKSGLLSKLEDNGFSLETVEKLKLLSTVEKTKLLSILSNRETPAKLTLASATLALAGAALIAAVPDDDASLIAAQAIGSLLLLGPAAGAAVASSIVGTLQKE